MMRLPLRNHHMVGSSLIQQAKIPEGAVFWTEIQQIGLLWALHCGFGALHPLRCGKKAAWSMESGRACPGSVPVVESGRGKGQAWHGRRRGCRARAGRQRSAEEPARGTGLKAGPDLDDPPGCAAAAHRRSTIS